MVRRLEQLVALLVLLVVGVFLLPSTSAPTVGGWMQAGGLKPQTLTIDGLSVTYVRAGQGDPILLLHGFASSIYTWKDVIPELAKDHDVVALDMPPFGLSRRN